MGQKTNRIVSSNERIKALIQYLGLSQIEFCNKTGLKPSALSNYVNGTRLPRQDALSKIAQAFDISPAWLMGYDTPMDADAAMHYIYNREEIEERTLVRMNKSPHRDLYHNLLIAADGCSESQIIAVTNLLKEMAQTNKAMEKEKKRNFNKGDNNG